MVRRRAQIIEKSDTNAQHFSSKAQGEGGKVALPGAIEAVGVHCHCVAKPLVQFAFSIL